MADRVARDARPVRWSSARAPGRALPASRHGLRRRVRRRHEPDPRAPRSRRAPVDVHGPRRCPYTGRWSARPAEWSTCWSARRTSVSSTDADGTARIIAGHLPGASTRLTARPGRRHRGDRRYDRHRRADICRSGPGGDPRPCPTARSWWTARRGLRRMPRDPRASMRATARRSPVRYGRHPRGHRTSLVGGGGAGRRAAIGRPLTDADEPDVTGPAVRPHRGPPAPDVRAAGAGPRGARPPAGRGVHRSGAAATSSRARVRCGCSTSWPRPVCRPPSSRRLRGTLSNWCGESLGAHAVRARSSELRTPSTPSRRPIPTWRPPPPSASIPPPAWRSRTRPVGVAAAEAAGCTGRWWFPSAVLVAGGVRPDRL